MDAFKLSSMCEQDSNLDLNTTFRFMCDFRKPETLNQVIDTILNGDIEPIFGESGAKSSLYGGLKTLLNLNMHLIFNPKDSSIATQRLQHKCEKKFFAILSDKEMQESSDLDFL